MTTPAVNNQPPNLVYELGRMTEALSQNTITLTKLTEAVEENSRSTAQLASRQTMMEAKIEACQEDHKRMLSFSMTGQSNETEVRRRFEFLERQYQKDQEAQGLAIHAKKALLGAVAVAVLWWGWALIREAAISEVATQLNRVQEFKQ